MEDLESDIESVDYDSELDEMQADHCDDDPDWCPETEDETSDDGESDNEEGEILSGYSSLPDLYKQL